ncbi:uncharacterized protein N7498_007081 [Penicillium cinerascens]|uniref:Uncharacterized protein n=1 Tax=Penicillium cinerascens TaxID=70096 RepID=A0A9W9MDN3_9EURO|nr:uncharacterized protein N7498_007081 [Penicillium cinerascens]KAJ5197964.1 hypothetical protein N7498_007081 [Penicillium cinerascens]
MICGSSQLPNAEMRDDRRHGAACARSPVNEKACFSTIEETPRTVKLQKIYPSVVLSPTNWY